MVNLDDEVIFITLGSTVLVFPLYDSVNYNKSTETSNAPSRSGGFVEYPSAETADVLTFDLKVSDGMRPRSYGNAIVQGQASDVVGGGAGIGDMSTKRGQIAVLESLHGQDVKVATPAIANYEGFVSNTSVSEGGKSTKTAMVSLTIRKRPANRRAALRPFKATTIRVPVEARVSLGTPFVDFNMIHNAKKPMRISSRGTTWHSGQSITVTPQGDGTVLKVYRRNVPAGIDAARAADNSRPTEAETTFTRLNSAAGPQRVQLPTGQTADASELFGLGPEGRRNVRYHTSFEATARVIP